MAVGDFLGFNPILGPYGSYKLTNSPVPVHISLILYWDQPLAHSREKIDSPFLTPLNSDFTNRILASPAIAFKCLNTSVLPILWLWTTHDHISKLEPLS